MFFVQTNHTRKELLFLMFKEINLRNHSSLHKLFYSLINNVVAKIDIFDVLIFNKNKILNANATKGKEINVIKIKATNR